MGFFRRRRDRRAADEAGTASVLATDAPDGVLIEPAREASGALAGAASGDASGDAEVIDLRDPIGDAGYYDHEPARASSGEVHVGAGSDAIPMQVAGYRAPDWDEPSGAATEEVDSDVDLAGDAGWGVGDEPRLHGSGGDVLLDGSDSAQGDEPATRRRSWRFWVLVGVGVVLLGAAVAAFAVFGPFLRTKVVQISGADGAAQAEILRAAAVAMDAPLATAPIGEIAERVAALPDVREVTVKREYPDSLSIAVQMRTPVAQVLVDDKSVLVDAQGVPFTEPAKPAKRLPAIKAPTPELMADAAEVAGTLPASIRRRTETISAPASNQVELTLRKGQRVLWGDASDPELKGQVLLAMLKPVVVKNVTDDASKDPPVFTWFDVSTPTAPTAAVVMPESRLNRCAPPASGSTSTNIPLGCSAADIAAAAEAAGIPLDEALGQGADPGGAGQAADGTPDAPAAGGAETGGASQPEIPSDTAN